MNSTNVSSGSSLTTNSTSRRPWRYNGPPVFTRCPECGDIAFDGGYCWTCEYIR